MLMDTSLRTALGVRLVSQAAHHTANRLLRTQLEEVVQTGICLPSDAPGSEVDDITWIVWDAVNSLPLAAYDQPLRTILHRTVQAAVLGTLGRLGDLPVPTSRSWEPTDDRGAKYEGISSNVYVDARSSRGRLRSHDPSVEKVIWLRASCNFLICTAQPRPEWDEVYIDPVEAGDGRRRGIVYEVESAIRRDFCMFANALLTIELERLAAELGRRQTHGTSDSSSMQTALTAIRAALFRDALADGNVDDADRFLVDALGLKFTDSAARAAGREALWLVINRSRSWSDGDSADVKHQLCEKVNRAKDVILLRSCTDDRSLWQRDGEDQVITDALYLSTVPELAQSPPPQSDTAGQFIWEIDTRRRSGEQPLTILQSLMEAAAPPTHNWHYDCMLW